MMDLFKPTESEITAALKGGKCDFKEGETVQFIIESVASGKGNENDATVISTKVLTGDNVDMKHSFWFRENTKGNFFKIMLALFPQEDIIAGRVNPNMLIGKKIQSVAKLSTNNGKTYTNFWDYSEVGGAPDLTSGQAAATNPANVPF